MTKNDLPEMYRYRLWRFLETGRPLEFEYGARTSKSKKIIYENMLMDYCPLDSCALDSQDLPTERNSHVFV